MEFSYSKLSAGAYCKIKFEITLRYFSRKTNLLDGDLYYGVAALLIVFSALSSGKSIQFCNLLPFCSFS